MRRLYFVLLFCTPLVTVFARAWAAEESPIENATFMMAGEGEYPYQNSIDYDFHDVPGTSGPSPTMTDNRETGRYTVSKTDTDTWVATERLGLFHVAELGPVPGTPETMPMNLWSTELGGAYTHNLERGRVLGLNLGIGSDSDELFHSIHETTIRAGANYRLPSGEHNAWIFSLNYSNNRYFFNNIPLPGVGYYFEALDRRLQGLVGFPFFALRYRPTDDWTMRLSLFGPRNVNAEINRRIVGSVRIYTAFIWRPQQWELADRADNTNRLFYDKKKVALGLRTPLSHTLLLDVSGGREFDRRFFENDNSSYSSVPTIGLAPAWYGETRISWRFGAPPPEMP